MEPEAKRAREASPSATSSAPSAPLPAAPTPPPARTKPQHNTGKVKRRRNFRKLPEPYSPADVTYRDVVDALGKEYTDAILARGDESEWEAPEGIELQGIYEFTPISMTVSGELAERS